MALEIPSWPEVRARPALLGGLIVAIFAILLAIGVLIAWLLVDHRSAPGGRAAPPPANSRPVTDNTQLSATQTEDLAAGLELQDLSPEEAMAYNRGIPVSDAPMLPIGPFVIPAESRLDLARATDCLTAAIYYEAGYEKEAGQRAVAQVVLNRARHFAYPRTVCGVVFEGSYRKTGCQFTFSCDGSIARLPDPKRWAVARRYAQEALAGTVERSVGRSTHYHADYVAPYWQPTLVKLAVIGRHIFYRGAGSWSTAAAFANAYAGGEPDIAAMAPLWSEETRVLAEPPVVAPDLDALGNDMMMNGSDPIDLVPEIVPAAPGRTSATPGAAPPPVTTTVPAPAATPVDRDRRFPIPRPTRERRVPMG